MHSEVSWLGESCTVSYPESGSHAQRGILTLGIMHTCTVRYPGPMSNWHVFQGTLLSPELHNLILMLHVLIASLLLPLLSQYYV